MFSSLHILPNYQVFCFIVNIACIQNRFFSSKFSQQNFLEIYFLKTNASTSSSVMTITPIYRIIVEQSMDIKKNK